MHDRLGRAISEVGCGSAGGVVHGASFLRQVQLTLGRSDLLQTRGSLCEVPVVERGQLVGGGDLVVAPLGMRVPDRSFLLLQLGDCLDELALGLSVHLLLEALVLDLFETCLRFLELTSDWLKGGIIELQIRLGRSLLGHCLRRRGCCLGGSHTHLLHGLSQLRVELLPVLRIGDPAVQIDSLLEDLRVAQCFELVALLRKLLRLLSEGSLKLLPPVLQFCGQLVGVELAAIEGLLCRRRLGLDLVRGLRLTLGRGRCWLYCGLLRGITELRTSGLSECLDCLFVAPLGPVRAAGDFCRFGQCLSFRSVSP